VKVWTDRLSAQNRDPARAAYRQWAWDTLLFAQPEWSAGGLCPFFHPSRLHLQQLRTTRVYLGRLQLRAAMGKYDHIAARTDDDIGDEEAGRMRARLAEDSRARKAAEAARIRKANEENRKRLAGITARTDDGDGLIGGGSPGSSPGTSPWKMTSRSPSPKRDELGEVRDLLQQRFKDRVKEENKAHLEKLANIKPTIDDDTEDDATGEARARLKTESAERRKAEAQALRAKNAQFFSRVKKVGATPPPARVLLYCIYSASPACRRPCALHRPVGSPLPRFYRRFPRTAH
jgi:hypothetical protein